jgi:hypothetical protein
MDDELAELAFAKALHKKEESKYYEAIGRLFLAWAELEVRCMQRCSTTRR